MRVGTIWREMAEFGERKLKSRALRMRIQMTELSHRARSLSAKALGVYLVGGRGLLWTVVSRRGCGKAAEFLASL